MKKIVNKILKNKINILAVAFVCITIFIVGSRPSFAGGADIALGGVGAAVSLVLGLIAYIITFVVGLLITLLVAILVQVSQYSGFIDAPIVTQGWMIIRDLCNMVFILVLLVIAFATILRMDSYNWKTMLPKLLIMAVLINFSRTIFGLIIDFSQVIMLTFVSAFANGGGLFISAFNVDKLLSLRSGGDSFTITAWSTAAAVIAGVIAAIITLIVVGVMVAVLVMRIIMIWIYTIFSPLVFLGFAVPSIQKYTGRIWEDFIKQVIVGPVLAFFLWLALTTASTSSEVIYNSDKIKTGSVNGAEICAGVGQFFCEGSLMKFIVVIGILFGGLMVAQQMGGAAGSIAGRGAAAAKKSAFTWSGARFASERWSSFQGKRDSERKARASEFGERAFGMYRRATQVPGATAQGIRAVSTARAGSFLTRGMLGLQGNARYEAWQRRRQDRNTARQHIYDAADHFEHNPNDPFTREGIAYTRNQDGSIEARRGDNVILRRGQVANRFMEAFRQSNSPAMEIRDNIWHSRINNAKKRLDSLSVAELRRVTENVLSSATDRMAATMALVQKEGFRNMQNLQESKAHVADLPSLLKEFNENADKRHAFWNNSRRNDQGNWEVDEDTIINKVSDGSIKLANQATDQLTSGIVDMVARITGPKLTDTLEDMIKTNNDRDNVRNAMGQNIQERSMEGVNLDVRRAYGQISGQVVDAFTREGRVVVDELVNTLRNAKPKLLGRIDMGVIRGNENFRQAFAQATDFSQIKSFERSGESPERLREYLNIAWNSGRGDLIESIEHDQQLMSIINRG